MYSLYFVLRLRWFHTFPFQNSEAWLFQMQKLTSCAFEVLLQQLFFFANSKPANRALKPGTYLVGGGALGHGPPFGSPGLQNWIEKWAKLRHGPPLCKLGIRLWARNHLILGENLDEIWVWQFQILIYVPFKFSEVSGPPFSKSCVRYCLKLSRTV